MAKNPAKDAWKRVRQVIDRYEYGNVSAAARRIHLPGEKDVVSQRGLAKVYTGETANPGIELLIGICMTYPVDPAWLLLGVDAEEWASSEERVQHAAREMAIQVLSSCLGAMGGEPVRLDGQVTANRKAKRAAS